LRERGNVVKLAALQKAQEVESLSKGVARLLRQSFLKGNELKSNATSVRPRLNG